MNDNNKYYIPIYSAVDTILIAATIVMAILKYNAGYDIPTIIVFTPLIAIAIIFGIRLGIALIALGVITLWISMKEVKDIIILTNAMKALLKFIGIQKQKKWKELNLCLNTTNGKMKNNSANTINQF